MGQPLFSRSRAEAAMTRLPSIALACAVVLMAACSHPVANHVDACGREPVPEVPVAIQLVPAGAATIEVHVRGSGAAIVLLPGTGGDASQYDTIAPILSAAGYRTIALSVRGAGRSEGPLDGLTLHDYADDVAGAIRSLGVAPVHVLGRAGGNRVARMLATNHPDLVASVILVNAGGLVPADPSALQAMRDWSAGHLAEAEALAAFRKSMLAPATDPRCVQPFAQWPAANAGQFAASAATAVGDWWTAGRARVLILQGADDLIAPVGNGHALARELGNRAKLVDIPDAGHALLFEQPRRVADEVLDFLQDLNGHRP
jgi:pimeloyl-ACP methyl ester carboxylesterase